MGVLPVAITALACMPGHAQPIEAFCIDFNWGEGGPNAFAEPGLWADASPEEHVAWYEALGANVIQTFAVSCNGYAWYKGGIVPEQPGLKHDFLTDVVRLGHARDIRVMGYFCVGANTLWGQTRPDLSYGHPSAMHIPFTTEYLDYLATAIDDAIRVTGMDGFMIDWVFNTSGQWLECEQAMYAALMGEPFPGKDAVTDEMLLEFNRKAVDRCWARIRDAARAADPDCVIWLTCHDVLNPMVADSAMFREVDWLMNEATDPAVLDRIREVRDASKPLIQCVVGWGDRHDAHGIIVSAGDQAFGLYGFAKPRPDSLPLPIGEYRDRPIASFSGNDRNIAVLARHYTGASLDTVVQQTAAGEVTLLADTANARGTSPVIADGQIGNWGNPADSVTWLVEIDKPGPFDVELEYACLDGSGGSTFEVRVGDAVFRLASEETGSRRDYRLFPLGEAAVAAGRLQVTIQPITDTPWNAISVKSITLRPTN